MIDRKNILIVGLGLLGGSYAQALTKKGYAVRAIDPKQSSLDYALENGFIEKGSAEVDPALVGWAELAVFALYPHVFVEWVREHGHLLAPGTIVTDVTGVKSAVVYEVQDLLPEGVEFIAAHPMAGREVGGVENSTDAMFRGANYIVTPTEKNTPEAIALCRALGEELGFAKVRELDPDKHDEMIGFLSQLTHCIAISLMTANTDPSLADYTGDSFRDLTRIARINEDMWTELFLLNKKKLVAEIDAFSGELNRMRTYLNDGNTEKMKEMMRVSTERRALFDKKL